MKNTNQKLQIQHFIFVVMILGLTFVQSYSAEAISSTGESNAFSVYTINSLADINRGLSLYSDGDGSWVEIPKSASFDFTDEFTLEVWTKPNEGYGNEQLSHIVSRWGAGGDAAYLLGVNSSGQVLVFTHDSVLYSQLISLNTIPTNSWSHIAGVREGGTLKIYINGVLDNSLSNTVAPQASNYNLFIGREPAGGNNFNGLVDEVHIWNVARTQEQIRAAMDEKLQGNEPDLVAYFSFNDGTAYDLSQHSGNHGTLQGDAELVTLHGPWPQPKIGDVSGNDEITAHDAALILQYVVGLISEFPADSMVSPSAIEPRDYEISLPNVETSAGGRIQVPIAINDATGLLAGGITVKYDQTVLRATDVLCGGILSRSYWRKNTDLDGEVRFAFASGESPTESGRMLVIEFDVLPHAEGKTSPLILEDVNLSNSRSIMKIDGEVRVIPSTFALLQNFPNPFNPDTWLPYQLASASPVSISIYNAKGQLIRTLNLGYQNAGAYVTKGKAAYWDGKDNAGENVASGVYFYTLRIERQRNPDEERVEEFRYTRKMAIMK